MSNKSIKYRAYPSAEQEIQLIKTFGCCRFVYNQMLDIQNNEDKASGKYLSKKELRDYCTRSLKKEYPFLSEVDKCALENSVFDLSNAIKRYLKRLSKYPKYKSKRFSKQTYTTNNNLNSIRIEEKAIRLPKVGCIKTKLHRIPPDDWIIKTATVSKESDGKYYISVTFEYENLASPHRQNKKAAIGLDYKSNGLYVDSEGHQCSMPHFYRKSYKKLRKAQQKMSRKEKGSSNYEKQRARVSTIHKHIANQRKDFLHKKSTEIANQFTYVCVEDLDMKALSNTAFKNGKSVMDNGYGMFLGFLSYKLNDRGGQLVKVSKWFPSSQICHYCGYRNPAIKDMRIRKWNCPNCGVNGIDRDWNAAINIKIEGLSIIANALNK